MLQKERKERNQLEFVSIESLVPKEHLLRKIDAAVDFNKIYDFVEDLYCPNNGRPGIDPVVLFKMTLIQHIFGIPSLRKTAEEVRMNVGYRWFIGYLLNEETPHFSTLSYNFKHRYTPETVEKIFDWILNEINNAGYLSPETVFVDGTHIKANANIKKVVKKEIPKAAKIYEKQLMDEINKDREEHGKKPFDKPKPPEKKIVNESTTDPESGVFHKGEHKKCLAYTAQTACDKHGYVVDVAVNAGNVHDSVAFDGLYDRMTEKHPEIETVVMDAGYKTPWICKKVFDDKRVLSTAYKRPMTMKGGHEWWKYVYDEYYDCYICPGARVLTYSTTNRNGYKEYKSCGEHCAECQYLSKCTESKNHVKLITRHVWEEYMEMAEDIRHTIGNRQIYQLRKETIERIFGTAKEQHGFRYTQYVGKARMEMKAGLTFACMNLKKLAKILEKRGWNEDTFLDFWLRTRRKSIFKETWCWA